MWLHLQTWVPVLIVALTAAICFIVMSRQKPHPYPSRPGWWRRRTKDGSPGSPAPRPPDSGRGFSFYKEHSIMPTDAPDKARVAPPHRQPRHLSRSGRDIRRTSGMAGSTQPRPATT